MNPVPPRPRCWPHHAPTGPHTNKQTQNTTAKSIFIILDHDNHTAHTKGRSYCVCILKHLVAPHLGQFPPLSRINRCGPFDNRVRQAQRILGGCTRDFAAERSHETGNFVVFLHVGAPLPSYNSRTNAIRLFLTAASFASAASAR